MSVKNRYESLFKRDFKYNLELYLFKLFLNRELKHAEPQNFSTFSPDETIIDNYRRVRQLKSKEVFSGITISKIDEMFVEWYKVTNLKPYEEKFREIFKNKLEFSEFEKVYTSDTEKNQCHYCGITEYDIEKLKDKSEIKTKRLQTRGEKMEIDRIVPSGDYSKTNIILACYWCNNAKTDEFSYFEFKKFVAPKIQEIWEIRLKHILNPPEMRNPDKNETETVK